MTRIDRPYLIVLAFEPPNLLTTISHTIIIQYGIVLYIRDHGGLGFSVQQYHPENSLTFPIQRFGSIG